MAPVVHGLEDEYFDRMNFAYLDIDDPDNQAFMQQLGFRYQPQFFLLDASGNIIEQWVGRVAPETLSHAFDNALAQ